MCAHASAGADTTFDLCTSVWGGGRSRRKHAIDCTNIAQRVRPITSQNSRCVVSRSACIAPSRCRCVPACVLCAFMQNRPGRCSPSVLQPDALGRGSSAASARPGVRRVRTGVCCQWSRVGIYARTGSAAHDTHNHTHTHSHNRNTHGACVQCGAER